MSGTDTSIFIVQNNIYLDHYHQRQQITQLNNELNDSKNMIDNQTTEIIRLLIEKIVDQII